MSTVMTRSWNRTAKNDEPGLAQSEYLAIEGDYRRAYGELHIATTWMRLCQKVARASGSAADERAAYLAEAVVDRLLR
jgi:hypothetical protein